MNLRRLAYTLYGTAFGRLMSMVAHAIAILHRPFMIYGWTDPESGAFRKYARMSSSVIVVNKKNLRLGEQAWVWHHSVIDATEAVTIGEGCQIGAWVGIFTHGSDKAIRLLGKEFVHIPNSLRKAYTRGPVTIGPYTFIGSGSIILPGVTIGKGCLVAPGAVVTRDLPDYSVFVAPPGRIVGSTLDIDRDLIDADIERSYYDSAALAEVLERRRKTAEGDKS